MDKINELTESLLSSIDNKDKKQTRPYDTQAEIRNIKDGVAWVHIPGGIDETPVTLTMDAKIGDIVMVRVSGGKAWIVGNATSPPTDDTKADTAFGIAQEASDISSVAARAAENASQMADMASEAADEAQTKAQEAGDAAAAAGESLGRIEQLANSAVESANLADQSAQTALNAAEMSRFQLSIVEDVVGVLDLVSKNGKYILTEDIEVQEGKWYFIRIGEQEPYEYQIVQAPAGNPHDQGWYELDDISDSIRNYVSSHIVVDGNGMWLQQDGINSKLQLTGEGVMIHGPNGAVVGKYGSSAQIGSDAGFHIEIDGSELGFYEGENKVAYITNQQLYITQSVVLQQMDLGIMVADGGLGQWSWKVHPNGETPSRNNLNLKWIG